MRAYKDIPGFLERSQAAIQANKDGRYAEAAPAFEWLANAAFGIGEVTDAKLSAINALAAYVKAGDPDGAARFAKHVVDLLVAAGKAQEIAGVAKHALSALRGASFAAHADALSVYVTSATGGAFHDPNAPVLPAFCTACGAAVKPAEIVRPTPTTVACRYCGASLDRR